MQLDAELANHMSVLSATVAKSSATVDAIVTRLCSCFEAGGRLFFCGNGGSAADAQHVAAEFVNRLRIDRRALPAIALTTDTSILTCVANDASYEHVFARQVEALGQPRDILVGLSTSGRSPNVLAALLTAREKDMTTVGFTGEEGTALMAPVCDIVVAAASRDCARIQECHEFLWHVIAALVETRMFEDG